MSQVDERSYLLRRERTCRELAKRASDPAAHKIHLEMAELYARRAEELKEPVLRAAS